MSGDAPGDPAGPTIFLSAGEPSGDLHGAGLARALRARVPGVRLVGLGGPRMEAEGVELLAGLDRLAVMGFVEVLRHLPFFLGLRRRVFDLVDSGEVDLVVPIDYPGFNLRLARRARERGVPVLFYIAPQVWAWHRERVRDLARDVDELAVVLPFEEAFFRDAGVRARFVGHPLLDVPPEGEERAAWAARHGLDPARPILALFPGSRAQEVGRLLDLFSAAARRVAAARPEVQPVIAAGGSVGEEAYAGAPWPRIGETAALLRHANAALVKSGTTTLEAALAETPFVVAYRMNALSYAIARRVVDVPHIALANLVAEERVVPELVQDEATPEALADALLPLLDRESGERRRVERGLARVRERLGGGGAAERVADLAAELLERREGSRG